MRVSRACANKYWNDLCQSIQHLAYMGDIKEVYEDIKKAIGPVKKKIALLKDAQGNLIHDKSKQIDRWVEQYGDRYVEESEIHIDKIKQLPSFGVVPERNRLPTFDEMIEAVKQMPNNKSPVNDAIPAKVFICLDDTSLSKLYKIVTEIWREEKFP